MKSRCVRISGVGCQMVVLFGLLAACPVGLAQSEDLPKAETILDRFVEVTGGKAAHEKQKNRVAKGTLSVMVPGTKINGTITVYEAAPDKVYAVSELGAMGKSEEGVSDGVAWEKSTMQGARLKEGDEKATALRHAVFNSDLHWRKVYKKVKTIGIETVNGSSAYRLELTPESGKPDEAYFDKESGLQVKRVIKIPTPMGELPMEAAISDYRAVGGVKVPHKVIQKVMTQEVTLEVEKIEINVKIPEDRFDPPEDVRALIAKQGKDGKNKDKQDKKKDSEPGQ